MPDSDGSLPVNRPAAVAAVSEPDQLDQTEREVEK